MKNKLLNIGFTLGKLEIVTHDDTNEDDIIYIMLPNYTDAYLYAFESNLEVFFFGDCRDSEFFTLTVVCTQQIEDLLKSLNHENYK